MTNSVPRPADTIMDISKLIKCHVYPKSRIYLLDCCPSFRDRDIREYFQQDRIWQVHNETKVKEKENENEKKKTKCIYRVLNQFWSLLKGERVI
jgi:hypothetical protein